MKRHIENEVNEDEIKSSKQKLHHHIVPVTVPSPVPSTVPSTVPRQLEFCTKYKDIFELKQWISELSDETIIDNHLIAAKFTDINSFSTDISSCGVTSQAIMNLLLERNGYKISMMVFEHVWRREMLSDFNIIYVGMDACTCCCFPGHAFIIYCSTDICFIIQSFANQYTIKDFFDIMTMEKVNKYMKVFTNMYIDGIDDNAIKQLNKFTHVKLDNSKGCRLKDSRFDIYCYQSNQKFSLNQ